MSGSTKLIVVVFELFLILGGTLALSGIIVSKQPNSRVVFEKLMPFQALIGAVMIIMAIIAMVKLGRKELIGSDVPRLSFLIGAIVSILLGSVFGMVQLARVTSGGNQQRALDIIGKLIPYQMLLGLVALATGVVGLLSVFGIFRWAEQQVGL